MEKMLVSLCLLGQKCRFDGRDCLNDQIKESLHNKIVIGVCPELESGLSVPRKKCEIFGGDGYDVLDKKAQVLAEDGSDFSLSYQRGAEIILERVKISGVKKAIFKDNSPSCGLTHIYDGTFKGHMRPGPGVSTALLKRNDIEIISDEHFIEI